MLMTYVLYDLI